MNTTINTQENGGGGIWALLLGIVWLVAFLPALFISLFGGIFAGLGLGSSVLSTLFFIFIVSCPFLCLAALISSFMYHAKNKYGTHAPVYKLLMFAPIVHVVFYAYVFLFL